MRSSKMVMSILVCAAAIGAVTADDLTGADRILCAAADVRVCNEEDCSRQPLGKMNVPRFVDINLKQNKIRTTEASGEKRETPIERQERDHGLIILQGGEFGRAYSFAIEEATGNLTAAIATKDSGVIVFGSCTPTPGQD